MTRNKREVYKRCTQFDCKERAIIYKGTQELWCVAHREQFHEEVTQRIEAATEAFNLFARVKAVDAAVVEMGGELPKLRSR